jgi:hypothetical protein
MKSFAKHFDELLAYCSEVYFVDCHDHSSECGPKISDPILALIDGYFRSDLVSASSDEDVVFMEDEKQPIEARWPVFKKAWERTCHTGYAQVLKRVLKHFYSEDRLTLEALARMQGHLLDLTDEKIFDGILEEAKIAARIVDIWPDPKTVLDGSLKLSPRARLTISLPGYHAIRNQANVTTITTPLKRNVTSLKEYIDACWDIFSGYKKFGAVAFKDQSAYERTLDYGNPTFAQAEEVFNWFMEDPRRSASYPEGIKPLDDYLFHTFMRMARDLDLPVQIHTGHMAGIRNDVVKANAAGLVKLIELHKDVRFDLFHANWPYSGDLLFLAKNYPNIAIDFCWANIVDPIYCQDLFKQILSSVPHGKVHGYGTDYVGGAERAWAHAQITRENMAIALSEMVDLDYLTLEEAKNVAHDWMFANANQFFKLGLPES